MKTEIEKHEKAIKLHKLAIATLKLIDNQTRYKDDLELSLRREREKEPIRSFLVYPEKWYIKEIEHTTEIINYLKNRYGKSIS